MRGTNEFTNAYATCADNGNRGRVGAEANLEQWLTGLPSLTTGESKFGVTFDWEVEKLGVPGAVIVKNHHSSEFLLKTITLHSVPGRGTLTFVANSWIYPVGKYRYNRVFFSNDVSLSVPWSVFVMHFQILLACVFPRSIGEVR
jgi:linoleate 9S-lipoxygenase